MPSDEKIGVADSELPDPGRPVSATWSRKDGSSGVVKFNYPIDASGRAGLVSTKYLKNRRFTQGLKNVASWGYWKSGGVYGVGTHKEGSPYFEALQGKFPILRAPPHINLERSSSENSNHSSDASGWVWFIPLHNGTHSVGVVMNQEMSTNKKKESGSPSSRDFYIKSLDLVPGIKKLLSEAELISDVKSASDWSYSASSYATPYVRIAGDAGCFIDPFFSSGVHLALSSGLSAAVTVSASIRKDIDERTAATWHSKKVAEGYTRFLLVVLSSLKQIRQQDDPVLSDWDEEGFDRAFAFFRPSKPSFLSLDLETPRRAALLTCFAVIQGTVDADVKGELTPAEISNSIDFCYRAFAPLPTDEKEAVIQKMKSVGLDGSNLDDVKTKEALEELEKTLSPQELQIMNTIRARRMVRAEDSINIDNFTVDAINGMTPHLERGNLTLIKARAAPINYTKKDVLAMLSGEAAKGKQMHGEKGHDVEIREKEIAVTA